ncbi:MAG: hypothetical protein OEV91_06340, partial [Desulfobulbaceae bacterium]|nr:hypothetical protein [Desulfobulbaceae bacterium]
SLNKLGDVEQALNRFDEARAAYAESRGILLHLCQAFPGVPRYRNDLAWVKTRLETIAKGQEVSSSQENLTGSQ